MLHIIENGSKIVQIGEHHIRYTVNFSHGHSHMQVAILLTAMQTLIKSLA
jgi:hypothetical protein